MSKQPGLQLKIEQPELSPRSTRVWLEGIDISHALRELTFAWKPDELTELTLMISVREVDMDARTIAHLIALAEQKNKVDDTTTTTTRPEGAPSQLP